MARHGYGLTHKLSIVHLYTIYRKCTNIKYGNIFKLYFKIRTHQVEMIYEEYSYNMVKCCCCKKPFYLNSSQCE